jgi:hypothetical protein
MSSERPTRPAQQPFGAFALKLAECSDKPYMATSGVVLSWGVE